ncbi:MAG: hypothetical protein OEW37_07890 [Rhodospirillaceae bacterium]|nr:hypothetical protein [Rhodospirillaceae bacterium]
MITVCPAFCKSPKFLFTLSVVALIFGIASIISGGQVIFGPEEKRIAAGDYVPFVLWFNFVAGFAYVIAAVGLYFRAKWGGYLAIAIALGTALVFAMLGIHILMDGAFEFRTVWAMMLRTGVWVLIACVAHKNLSNNTD